MNQRLIKIDGKGEEHDFGKLPEEVIQKILKGYKRDAQLGFYGKSGTKHIYIIE